MKPVQKLVTQDSFDAYGVFIPAGHIGTFDEERINGDEKHLKDPGGFEPAIVQIAAIGPTGPNPTAPQQIPPDAVQTAGGGYATPGKVLVGEVTQSADIRLTAIEASDEAKTTKALSEVMDTSLEGQRSAETNGAATTDTNAGNNGNVENNDDGLVAGTVADVTKDLGTKTDEQHAAIQAAERDREKPRAGVLNAIQDELDARKENGKS
jgi:hypothetical protein